MSTEATLTPIDETGLQALDANLTTVFHLYCCGCGVTETSDVADRQGAVSQLHWYGWRARGEHTYCPKCAPERGFEVKQ